MEQLSNEAAERRNELNAAVKALGRKTEELKNQQHYVSEAEVALVKQRQESASQLSAAIAAAEADREQVCMGVLRNATHGTCHHASRMWCHRDTRCSAAHGPCAPPGH